MSENYYDTNKWVKRLIFMKCWAIKTVGNLEALKKRKKERRNQAFCVNKTERGRVNLNLQRNRNSFQSGAAKEF